jgi:hypothetical protein
VAEVEHFDGKYDKGGSSWLNEGNALLVVAFGCVCHVCVHCELYTVDWGRGPYVQTEGAEAFRGGERAMSCRREMIRHTCGIRSCPDVPILAQAS